MRTAARCTPSCNEQPTATRAVVVLHGYTESGEKFREMTWYFLQSGFSVYAIDHRGHGRSARAVDETWLTHIDHFSDYVRDLEAFMDRVVLPRAQNLPLCLYAHSMGGAVGSMMLQRHPKMFARAVLTAPMIAPSSAPFRRGQARRLQNSCAPSANEGDGVHRQAV